MRPKPKIPYKFFNKQYILTLSDIAYIGDLQKMCEHLTDPDVDRAQGDILGQTALMIAVQQNHLSVVKVLITPETIDLKAANGFTALIMAITHNHEKIVQELLKQHADVSVKDNFGNDALTYAKLTGNKTMIDLVQEYSDLREKKAAAEYSLRLFPEALVYIMEDYATPEFYGATPRIK